MNPGNTARYSYLAKRPKSVSAVHLNCYPNMCQELMNVFRNIFPLEFGFEMNHGISAKLFEFGHLYFAPGSNNSRDDIQISEPFVYIVPLFRCFGL